jgi:SAM-dependent methyltransferase
VLTAAPPAAPPEHAFDAALDGAPADLLHSDGTVLPLPVQRWRARAADGDGWLLDRCAGPAIDLGCGPGRLVAALAARGLPALGVDVSAAAQRQCRRRRAPMVRRDLFDPLPAEGCWDHVLLVDGNIGIGGAPQRLLRRAARLLAAGGTVLVEADPRPDLLWRGTAAIRTAHGTGDPLPWARVGAAALAELAAAAGLTRTATHRGARCFVELTRVRPGASR